MDYTIGFMSWTCIVADRTLRPDVGDFAVVLGRCAEVLPGVSCLLSDVLIRARLLKSTRQEHC
jgi:hypothetical protein